MEEADILNSGNFSQCTVTTYLVYTSAHGVLKECSPSAFSTTVSVLRAVHDVLLTTQNCTTPHLLFCDCDKNVCHTLPSLI